MTGHANPYVDVIEYLDDATLGVIRAQDAAWEADRGDTALASLVAAAMSSLQEAYEEASSMKLTWEIERERSHD